MLTSTSSPRRFLIIHENNHKMLLFVFLVIPIVLAGETETKINNYIIKIINNTLISVQAAEKSYDVLNLSGLGLHVLEKDVFNNLSTLKSLNLANNSLSSLSQGLFSNLEKLEHLNLANNNISRFKNAFVGLNNLKTLNISNNRLKRLRHSELFGLPKSVVIFTEGISFLSINAGVFNKIVDPDSTDDEDDDDDRKNKNKKKIATGECGNCDDVKVCIQNDVLMLVEPLKRNETLPIGCRKVKTQRYSDTLSLKNLGISKIEKGWCRLENSSIYWISLVGNKIVQVTKELLNDLPEDIHRVSLARNKIKRLENGVIDNKHLLELNLASNAISEIEEGALSKTSLFELFLAKNLLKDTKFVASLPTNTNLIDLANNKIAEISPGSFTNGSQLQIIFLDGNLIQELKTGTFDSLRSLRYLRLSNNLISSLQPGCFQHVPHLVDLRLQNNSISNFPKGVLNDLPGIRFMDVSYNKLTNVKNDIIDGLPRTLTNLNLDYNAIEKLDRGTFVNVPLGHLTLKGNKISKVEQGAFDIPDSITLNLDYNRLGYLDVNSFQGLDHILSLSLEANNITKIPQGFTKNLDNLRVLNLGYNPIKRLENGTLPGMRRSEYAYVYLDHGPIEIIEGGLFDDM